MGMMLATMLGLVACDEHRDFPDTGMKVGISFVQTVR